jgi:hypothetical protein
VECLSSFRPGRKGMERAVEGSKAKVRVLLLPLLFIIILFGNLGMYI